MSAPAPLRRAVSRQAAMELRFTARRGENLLAIAVIPAVVLVFFASTSLIAVGEERAVDFLVPGAIALAVIATGLVNLGISTAYERQYGVLKRLGGSPLGRTGLLAAKVATVAVIVASQVVLLTGVAIVALSWAPGAGWSPVVTLAALVVGTIAFAALGLLLAGTLRAEGTLALANGLFIASMLLGGVIIPLSHVPPVLAMIAEVLPAAALSDALRMGLGGSPLEPGPWIVLVAWAAVTSILTARTFRWD